MFIILKNIIFGEINLETMKFEITKSKKFNRIFINEYRLTAEFAPAFKTELVVLIEDEKSIICDMEYIDYIDSSGLSCFLVGYRMLKELNCKFVICNTSKKVMNLIKLTKLDSVLTIVGTVKEAKDFILLDELEKNL